MNNFKCAHTDVKKVSELMLLQNPKNANKHSKEQIQRLSKIIDFQGQRAPIVLSKLSGFIVKGHGRLYALDQLKWESAAVDYQDYRTEAEEYADMIADNEIARWAEFDVDKLKEDLMDIDLGDIELLGLKDIPDFLEENKKEFEADEDEVPEVTEPKAKLGDIYQLGEHRLMCGDSTSVDAVDKLMNGDKADMVFTDPPYGVDYQGGSKKREKLADDHVGTNIYEDTVPLMAAYCNGPIYTWYADTKPLGLYSSVNEVGDMHSLIIWNKNNSTFNMNIQYKQKHEPCLYWKPKGKTLLWDGPTTESTVWDLDRESKNEFHPTQKPVGLAERAISNHKAPKVLDFFGGSGSTLIACEKTNRKCFMMELDPHYVDVIITRWENFTGNKAELLNG